METITYIYTDECFGKKYEVPYTFKEKSTVIASVKSVAKSGMSRTISFYLIENNQPIDITCVIAQVLGHTLQRDCTIRVRGCGMDMIFATLSAFASRIGFKKDPYWCEHYYRI